jgi:hypothetical protein
MTRKRLRLAVGGCHDLAFHRCACANRDPAMTVGLERAQSTTGRVPAKTSARSVSDFEVVCLFAAAGLAVTGLMFALIGFAEVGRAFAVAG